MKQFDQFTASELACPRCRISRPVRQRLLLVLPHSELYDYRCTVCGESCGTREVTTNAILQARAAQAAKTKPAHPASAPRKTPRALLK